MWVLFLRFCNFSINLGLRFYDILSLLTRPIWNVLFLTLTGRSYLGELGADVNENVDILSVKPLDNLSGTQELILRVMV